MKNREIDTRKNSRKQARRRLLQIGLKVFFISTLILSLLSTGSNLVVRAATSITFTAEEMLGKPTDTTITINIVPASQIEYHYQYRTESEVYNETNKTSNYTAPAGQPHEITIEGLTANTHYYYRMRYHAPGDATDDWVVKLPEHSFWTQRAPGSTFIFTVTSDDHHNINTYTANAMQSILNDPSDFHVDLGDTFYVSPSMSQSQINTRYLDYRQPLYFGKIGPSVPIFLSSGNHEDEEGWNLDDTNNVGVGSIQARKAYFPTPIDQGEGGFYSGNTDILSRIDAATYGDQYREDYYAWEWGDALFVVIDPFQYTMNLPYSPNAGGAGDDDTFNGNQWSWTLGKQQYDWLTEVLENSNASYKFMFSHNMLGGVPRPISGVEAGYVRGGAEAAAYFEWGGNNADGTWGWDTNRPASEGWTVPIHQLMVDNGVSAYFHGHDHQYVYETRDGIVYQEVPSPGMTMTGFTGIYTVGDFGEYETFAIQPSTGYLRLTVTPDQTTVDYVRSGFVASGGNNNGEISYTYTIEPNNIIKYNLNISVDPVAAGTTNPPVGDNPRAEGSTVNVTATPALGYAFDHWSGNCTGSGACSVLMDADKSVTAHFKTVSTFNLTTAVSPASSGTVSPSGTTSHNPDTVVNLTATAASGYTFANWTGDAVANASSASTTVTMNADKSVTANFSLACYPLTRTHTGSGLDPVASPLNSEGCSPGQYHAGAEITLTASPSSGYQVASWTGTTSGGSASLTNTLTMPAGARTVSVSYTLIPPACYLLTLGHTGSGADPVASPTNSPSCPPGRYNAGQVIDLSGAIPAAGYWISGWEGTDYNSNTSDINWLTMPANDHLVRVNYVTQGTPTCYFLTLTHEGQGTDPVANPANSTGCDAGRYVAGEAISLSGVVPGMGWFISGWTGTSNNSSTAITNSLSMPAGARTVSVVYVQGKFIYLPCIIK